jgi:hypothetical protein
MTTTPLEQKYAPKGPAQARKRQRGVRTNNFEGYCPVCRNHKIVYRSMCATCEARGGRPFSNKEYPAGKNP